MATEAESLAVLQAKIEQLEAKSVVTDQLNVTRYSGPTQPFVDRHGMIALAFAVLLQTAGIVWWASKMDSNITVLQEESAKRDDALALLMKTVEENAERLTRVQTVQENVVKILDRVQELLNERGPRQ